MATQPSLPHIPSLSELTVQEPVGDLLDIEPLQLEGDGVGTAALALERGPQPADTQRGE